MNYRQMRELSDRVRGVPLELVLEASGARRDSGDRTRWRTERGPLSVTGAKFMNWKHGVGGGGAIDLALHLRQKGFVDAVSWLAERFPNTPEARAATAALTRKLELPPADELQLSEVRRYLLRDRCLAASLIDPLVESGQIYADRRGNAVFVHLAEDGTAVGAELRGTTRLSWHGMAPGSSKDGGYFSVGVSSATAVVLTESAIDAVSCAEIHPDRLCVSTAGVRSNPRWLQTLLDKRSQVYCGFDSDSTGDQVADAMIAHHSSLRRLRPAGKDWNDTLRSIRDRS